MRFSKKWLVLFGICALAASCERRTYELYEYEDQRGWDAPAVSFCIPTNYLTQMFSSSEPVAVIGIAYEHGTLLPWLDRKTANEESVVRVEIQPKHGKSYRRPPTPSPLANAPVYPGVSPTVYVVERPPMGTPSVVRPALPGIVSPHLSLVPADVALRQKYDITCSSNDDQGKREYCWVRFDSSEGFPLVVGANSSSLADIDKTASEAEKLVHRLKFDCEN